MKRFVIIILLLLVTACIQSPSNNRRTLLNNNVTALPKTPANNPVFTQGVNYFQNSSQIFLSSFPLTLDFKDIVYLRGKDIDTYIRSSGTQTSSCVVSTIGTKTLVLSAIPQSIYNFTNQSIEYYYSVSFSDNASNQNFCNKPGVTSVLIGSLIYDMGSLCVNGICSTNYSSSSLDLYSGNGTIITQVNLKNLSLSLTAPQNISTQNGTTCINNTQCSSLGYDCCSNGQCVKDLALKPGVNSADPAYQQALQDILNRPSNIYLYPNYYFICSAPVAQPTTPVSTITPVNAALTHLKKLENLYNCTTKTYGEAGVCTKTISNPIRNTPYSVGLDDISFQSTYENLTPLKDTLVSVTEVSYGDIPLYNFTNKDEAQLSSTVYSDTAVAPARPYVMIAGQHNYDVSTAAQITLLNLPDNALNTDLVIKYLVDSSCNEINPTLAKCEKYYIQGQKNSGSTIAENRYNRLTDHFPASNYFKLPYYANVSQALVVEVDGVVLKQDIDWKINLGSPNVIQLLTPNGSLKAFDSQKVKISFFVNLSVYKVTTSKQAALNEIKTMCSCADTQCSLAPIKNSLNAVTDYACVYPAPAPVVAPTSQLVYLSSKTVPVRYFDSLGASQTLITGSTPAQEGKLFEYIKNDPAIPNNMPSATITDPYVGFNEIYGSLTYGINTAKPAKEVSVNIGKVYDIYVDRGAYSTCLLCGNDYYSTLNKLFPLAQFGGGLIPNRTQTSNLESGIRADDFSFGRACTVPATMIPWTHSISSVVGDQRMNRMRAQHFLFANGYQHDWYGFDFGSVIGSFDGVKWFSIGSSRRIKATTNKLFIAVNGALGDLTIENTYNVTINDSSLNPVGTGMATTDFDSDGAQCQRYHQCSTDNDCATTLGWDYACAPINESTTPWPVFDANGSEIPDSKLPDNRLVNILGISSGGKRCVYRGRGSACSPDSSANFLTNLVGGFNESKSEVFHTCSNNNFCQTLSTPNSFNNRIVRFGKVMTDPLIDTVGFGARNQLRPLDYQGQETIRTEALKNLSSNHVTAICKPGRNPEVAFASQNATPSTTVSKIYDGDKILGLGMSYSKLIKTVPQPDYLSSCSILDDFKNYYYSNISGGTTNLSLNAGTQAISTNALDSFTRIFTQNQMTFPLLSSPTSIIKTATFQENRCLRAPGATCFQDLECAPSKLITDKTKLILPTDASIGSIIQLPELKFWQEELVCSQPMAKTDPLYDPARNYCCREVGKTISIASSTSPTVLAQKTVAGIDLPMSSLSRYSRVATAYKEMNTTPTTYPPLDIAVDDSCSGAGCKPTTGLNNQFNTFSLMASKTSCSGHWVRNFATGVNNHNWDKSSLQNIDASTFRCLNWAPNNTNNSCTGLPAGSIDCKAMQTWPELTKARGVFAFYGLLELTGIPQIAIPAQNTFTTGLEGSMSCKSNPNLPSDMAYPSGAYQTPLNIWAPGAISEFNDGSTQYLSGLDSVAKPNFKTPSVKQIFKADEVVSCLPAGTTVAATADPNTCCTGFIDAQRGKCALRDFVDVTVYTNRYVSSAGSQLANTSFDATTGYLTDPSIVANLACQQQICASGTMLAGVLVSKLLITGWENFNRPEDKIFRFLEGQILSDDSTGLLTLYKQGLKINTHLYCFPKSAVAQATTAGLTPITCGY